MAGAQLDAAVGAGVAVEQADLALQVAQAEVLVLRADLAQLADYAMYDRVIACPGEEAAIECVWN